MSAWEATMFFRAQVHVKLKSGIADPQGQTIERALPALGYEGVSGVRVGKVIEFELQADGEEAARSRTIEMCERLLANTVIESYEVFVTDERAEMSS
jgi:phosphoribosylformylglycinamidine synthase